MVTAALFTMAKTWKQPKCPPTDEWIKITVYICMYVYVYTYIYIHTYICMYVYVYIHIYTHTKEYYSAKKKAVMLFAATWMDLEMTILSKVSQKDKYYITYM